MVSYLHDKNIVHRDIKLENILFDQFLTLKLTDFGFATNKHVKKLHSYLGTKSYMAPEIIEEKPYDGQKADVFSLGVVLFIIVHGIFPFCEARPNECFYKYLIKGKHDKYFKKTGTQHLSDNFKDLIVKMLSYNPADRPTIQDIKDHPWM